MRILHVNDRLSGRGGADLHLLAVLHHLDETDHELSLAVSEHDGTAAADCPVHLVDGLAEKSEAPHRLQRLCADLQPDVIHLHNVVNPAVLRYASRHTAVMTVQDHRLFCPGPGKVLPDNAVCRRPLSRRQCRGCFDNEAYFRRLLATTLARQDAAQAMPAIVLSRYMRRELVATGWEEDQVHVMPSFVHALPEVPPDGPPCVLFCGRLVDAKGIDDAIAAWRLSQTQLPLVFAGTGSARNRLEQDGFQVLGWRNRNGVAAALARAKALLFPPRWQEPFGIVGLEALARKVPVVAWRSGGIAEWHPGGPLLVPRGDILALANALKLALDDPHVTPLSPPLAPRAPTAPPFSPPVTPDQRTTALLDLYASLRT